MSDKKIKDKCKNWCADCKAFDWSYCTEKYEVEKPMDNKQPKELWIPNYISTQKVGQSRISIAPYKIESTDLKYVSETYHNEIVEGLKEGIRKLQEQFDENGGNLPPLIQLQRISANVTDIIKNYFEENKKLKEENEHNVFYINQLLDANERLIAEIESLKSKAESKRKHWNTK